MCACLDERIEDTYVDVMVVSIVINDGDGHRVVAQHCGFWIGPVCFEKVNIFDAPLPIGHAGHLSIVENRFTFGI